METEMKKTVLFVDDESNILASLKRLLRHEEYYILTATSAAEGLEILSKNNVQMVVSDQRMPEMAGNEFLQLVKRKHADTVRVILSGYADVNVILDAINKGEIFRFLTKPWNDEELKISLRQCLEHYDLIQENSQLLRKISQQNETLTQMNENLETVIDQRTQSLKLAQDILENLPIAVIGLSTEGIISLTNHVVRTQFNIHAGQSVYEVFSEPRVQWILDFLNQEIKPSTLSWEEDGTHYLMEAKLLYHHDQVRGGLILLEREKLGVRVL